MANGNNVVSVTREQGIEVFNYENTERGTEFKAYQFCLVEFVRGDDIEQRDPATRRWKVDEHNNRITGVSRTVSATTAMGGNLTHAVLNLKQGSFQRSVDFIKSALLPHFGKSMVEYNYCRQAKTITMWCDMRFTHACLDNDSVHEQTFTSVLNVANEAVEKKVRLLAAEEIAALIVGYAIDEMTDYLEKLEPDTSAEDKIADELGDVQF